MMGVAVPLIGDFHYNGHQLLAAEPACAEALAKYRINPGNVGFGKKHDTQFAAIDRHRAALRQAGAHRRQLGFAGPVMVARLMDENHAPHRAVGCGACGARGADPFGARLRRAGRGHRAWPRERIILSCKVSGVQELIAVYRDLAARCDYALHLGLTEAGMGSKGIVASTAALAVLLQEGIGDTIRISLTPEPGESRTREVIVAQELLQTMGLRAFTPLVTACPGCGRTTSTLFQELA